MFVPSPIDVLSALRRNQIPSISCDPSYEDNDLRDALTESYFAIHYEGDVVAVVTTGTGEVVRLITSGYIDEQVTSLIVDVTDGGVAKHWSLWDWEGADAAEMLEGGVL